MKLVFSFLLISTVVSLNAQLLTRYEQSGYKETATYEEAMTFYRALDEQYDEVSIVTHGQTDIGIPLNVMLISTGGEKTPEAIEKSGKAVWLINNAIHPGESDGVSASQMFARDLLKNKKKNKKVLDEVIIAIIPFYNVGGALNRNGTTRVNQNGPVEYGFRGNARHYDLNRDFIKSDTRNSRSFQELFQAYDPDLFLDTHVSNGADYQHIMMLLGTQKDKLGGKLGEYMNDVFMPYAFENMEKKGFSPVPYVNAWGHTPDKGWTEFIDWPRYSTGYAALFHSVGLMSETHMLKTYQQRVESTYGLMQIMLEFLEGHSVELIDLRDETKLEAAKQKEFEVSWAVDTSLYTPLMFKGYEPTYIESDISGLKRLKYDHNQPFTKEVKYKNQYVANKTIKAPKYYLIPQQWTDVIELLELNQVETVRLRQDTTIAVESYYIDDYQTSRSPYEGHYMHSKVKVSTTSQTLNFRDGDVLVPVNQWRNRYIVETLEPEAPDSFFAWNFFDAILQQKEHFSSYVFEDYAVELLEENPEIKSELEAAKQNDPDLAKSAYMQLEFIYQRSKHREPEYLRYPVFRVMD
ncbi:M14 family zinc carboxypeptidase [Marinoscillum pacificum]|uniref:M14 family zinc carboxypeptidase n=1 Tax=Marinoscillum pacificum TaxID=392723 RepID=UPI0021588C26|nr:M14 family zinc carboxypeptidase [Marinoscillum pacificum]